MKNEWIYDTEAGCINGDDFWYFSMQFNGLFHLDLQTGIATPLGKVPNEEDFKDRLYSSMHYFENKLFLIPFSAEAIGVYDIDNNEFLKINVCADEKRPDYYDANYKWQGSVLYENKIIMFGLTHSAIGILDCQTMKFNTNQKWIDCYEKEYGYIKKTKYDFYFEKNVVLADGCMYVTLGFSNKIMKYSLLNDDAKFISVGNEGDIFYNLIKVSDFFVLTRKNSNEGIIILDPINNVIEDRVSKIDGVSCAYASLIPLEDRFMLITLNEKKILVYNHLNKEHCVIDSISKYDNVYDYVNTDEFVVMYSASAHKIVRFDKKFSNVLEYDLYSDNNIVQILKSKLKMDTTENAFIERKNAGLSNYIGMLIEIDDVV